MSVPSVEWVEVGPRDGLQSWASPLPTPAKIGLITSLLDCGLRRVEATSMVHPKWVPQLADAEAVLEALQDRIDRLRVLVPNRRGHDRRRQPGAGRGVVPGDEAAAPFGTLGRPLPRHARGGHGQPVVGAGDGRQPLRGIDRRYRRQPLRPVRGRQPLQRRRPDDAGSHGHRDRGRRQPAHRRGPRTRAHPPLEAAGRGACDAEFGSRKRPGMSAAEPKEAAGDELKARSDAARAGGSAKYAEKLRQEHKLPVRRRLELLLDPDLLIEDGLLAHSDEPGYGADGVVPGVGRIDGRTVWVMANDPTVKAGSWGPRTVEKIVRIQETAERLRVPIFYLVDSAGARITDQVEMFPGRRHAGRIFYQEVQLSGVVPQVCLLFGPSAAGGAYIPAFCDVTIMVEGNASMYLGSPRMAELVIR